MYKRTRAKFDTYVDKGTLLHNFAHIFELLARLRQAVDHPYLIVHGQYRKREVHIPSKSCGVGDVCALCHKKILDVSDVAMSRCRHTFHRECVKQYLNKFGSDSNRDEEQKDQNSKKKKKGKKKVGQTLISQYVIM